MTTCSNDDWFASLIYYRMHVVGKTSRALRRLPHVRPFAASLVLDSVKNRVLVLLLRSKSPTILFDSHWNRIRDASKYHAYIEPVRYIRRHVPTVDVSTNDMNK